MTPIILVVDDSDVQRQLIGGLLKNETDYDIRFAWDGEDAYDYLEKSPADLVLTDLVMPGVDGLALIERLRSEHPETPVALVTAHGNEDIAGKALLRGAVNYVSKDELAERLPETVRQIVHRVQFDQQKAHIPKRLNCVELVETISSDPNVVEPLVDVVHQELIAGGTGDRTDRVRTCIALAEALLNAILHGNLQMSHEEIAELKASDAKGALERAIREKLERPYYARRTVTLSVSISAEAAKFIVQDDGMGFDVEIDATGQAEDYLQRGHPRGLILIQSLMDTVEFDSTVNQLALTHIAVAKGFSPHI